MTITAMTSAASILPGKMARDRRPARAGAFVDCGSVLLPDILQILRSVTPTEHTRWLRYDGVAIRTLHRERPDWLAVSVGAAARAGSGPHSCFSRRCSVQSASGSMVPPSSHEGRSTRGPVTSRTCLLPLALQMSGDLVREILRGGKQRRRQHRVDQRPRRTAGIHP